MKAGRYYVSALIEIPDNKAVDLLLTKESAST